MSVVDPTLYPIIVEAIKPPESRASLIRYAPPRGSNGVLSLCSFFQAIGMGSAGEVWYELLRGSGKPGIEEKSLEGTC